MHLNLAFDPTDFYSKQWWDKIPTMSVGNPVAAYGPPDPHDKVIVAWRNPSNSNSIEIGPARYKRFQQGVWYVSASPFPGAWDDFVRIEQIIQLIPLTIWLPSSKEK